MQVNGRHTVERRHTANVSVSRRTHGRRWTHPWRASDEDATLFCRAGWWTHGRPSAMYSVPRHTAETLCHRCLYRDHSVVCLHTADGLPWPKATLPCQHKGGTPVALTRQTMLKEKVIRCIRILMPVSVPDFYTAISLLPFVFSVHI
jgi:hypothetical protein